MNKVAIIIGDKGQDGTILSKKLKEKNYKVIGLNKNNFKINNYKNIKNLIKKSLPKRVFYLASYHNSSDSKIKDNTETARKNFIVNFQAPYYFLDAISDISIKSKFFYASSSMIYSNSNDKINESTLPKPVNEYGFAKFYAGNLCNFFRENKKVFASTGILFNHTSSFSKDIFVTKYIVNSAVDIYLGKSNNFTIGNINAVIDLGSAFDYVEAMIKILNISESNNFIISSGKQITLKKFIELTFKKLGLKYKNYIKIKSKKLTLPNEKKIGNNNFLKQKTGWKPSYSINDIIDEMINKKLS